MIEYLNNIDTRFFLYLNNLHNPFFDKVMWYSSSTAFWIPLYLLLLGYIVYKYKKQSIYYFIAIALVILISDQLASGIIKPMVERLRPSHDPSIQQFVHIINGYKGGKFGFVSSHAANTFGLAMFLTLLFRKGIFSLFIFIWAGFVSYSRIYLGVHYPGDIICGALIGILVAWLVKFAVDYFVKWNKNLKPKS